MLDLPHISVPAWAIVVFIVLSGSLVFVVVGMIDEMMGHRLKYSRPLNAFQRARRKARKGDPKACMQCVDMLEKGTGGASKSHDHPFHYMQRAAAIYAHRAREGDGHAALKLAEICNHGYRFPQLSKLADKAYRAALRLNEDNALRGDVNGLAFAGYQYRYGLGCVSDYDKAARYLEGAAKLGHAPSMKSLAELYLIGFKAKPDPITAARLTRQAALAGDPEAVERVGDNYLDSLGEPASREQAYFWYSFAAQKGRRGAMRKLEKIEQDWTPKQLREVQERLREWVPA
ncbi:MAG TPA: tetratricopeptide repeat protein [Asticcacaulis sp.]|nr:tetratricopeptide repeat protein [Asticcacaulis sp.]